MDEDLKEALDVWEGHPCRLCDPDGKCEGACEYADSVAPPTLRQCFGVIAAAAERERELVEALTRLVNAADNVDCEFFDTDDMPEVVTEMQEATFAARALQAKEPS
jgi:hypothetical protein